MPFLETNDGVRMFFRDEGADRAACEATGATPPPPALVFVHGFACTHEDWTPQIAHFLGDRRLIACDLPGHGASESHPDHRSVQSLGADVAALLVALDLPRPAVLVGHSMGCRVVLQAYLDAPERVAGLVLVDGSCVGTGDAETAERDVLRHIDEVGYASFVRGLFEDMFVEGGDEELKRRLIQRALTTLPKETGAPLFARTVAWDAMKMDTALSRIHVPVLAIQSTYINAQRVRVSLKPGETTPWTERLQRLVPSSQIEIVGGVGHFSMLEAPQIVNRAIEGFIAHL